MPDNRFDFAISYAGEDKEIAQEIFKCLIDLDFKVFLGDNERHILTGIDGENFFEQVFTDAKEVIVLISQHYKRKEWPRFEWDVIKERDLSNRFIPIRLDDSRILGLASNIIYLKFTGNNYEDIVQSCIYKLLIYEKENDIHRPTEYEIILDDIANKNKGALARAFQLVKDKRNRSPLSDCKVPQDDFPPSYSVIIIERCDFSVIKRISAKIIVPKKLSESKEELSFNLKHCAATLFNKFKPDALMVFAYYDLNNVDINSPFNAGRIIFAPFGQWEKAEEGFAYNIPTEQFEFSLTYS